MLTLSLSSSVLKLLIIRQWQFLLKGVGQLLHGRFLIGHLLLHVRLMMNKSMDQKPEVNNVIRFCFITCQARNWQHALNYELKRLSFSLLICRTQNKIFKGGLALVSFSSSWFDVKAKLQEPDFEVCSSATT